MRIRWVVSVVTGAFLSSFSMVTAVQAADYYVSPTGNDLNSGSSPSQAWRTINKVNNKTFVAGDHIFFQGGQTFGGNLNFDSSDRGNLANPITIGSYGSGRAVINAGLGRGFLAYNVAGYRIQNISFVGAGRTANTTDGILFYTDLPGNVKLEYIAIDNVEVKGFGNHGVSIGANNNKSGFRSVQITYVDSHDNGQAGITVWGFFSNTLSGYAHESVYIGYCKAYDNPGISGLAYNSGHGIVISDVNGGTIERCVAYNNGSLNTANGGPIGIWAWDANNITIQYNESHHNRTASATDGGGFDLDGGVTNSVMQYNYSHDNDGAGFLLAQFSGARTFSGNTLRYNISQNDGRKNGFAAIHLWNGGSGVKNSEIYNNTVYVSPAPSGAPRAIYFQSATTNIHVRNNLLVTTGGVRLVNAVSGQTGLLFQGNNYWSSGGNFVIGWSGGTHTSLSAWRAATSQERLGTTDVGLSVAPQLNNPGGGGTLNNADLLESLTAYQLQSTSPLINVGLDLFSLFGINNGGQDFYGIPIPQGAGADIGAHESTGLLAAYGFNEGSGTTAADASGNGNTGTLVNGPLWVPGQFGKALSFDKVNDHINAGSAANLDNLSVFSISAWINPRTMGAGGRGTIINKAAGGFSGGWRFRFAPGSTNALIFEIDHTLNGAINGTWAGTYRTTVNNVVSLNSWQHVTVTWDGTNTASGIHIYVNGVETAYSGNSTNTNGIRVSDATSNLLIGINAGLAAGWDGFLDEVKVFNRILTQAEVVNDMNTPL